MLLTDILARLMVEFLFTFVTSASPIGPFIFMVLIKNCWVDKHLITRHFGQIGG